ncbi:MAG: hypothetical protein AAFV62_07895 [Pseudomonadota bacterium]
MSSCRELADALGKLRDSTSTRPEDFPKLFRDVTPEGSPYAAARRIGRLFDSAHEEVVISSLSERAESRAISAIEEYYSQFYDAIRKNTPKDFYRLFDKKMAIESFYFMSDIVEEKREETEEVFDRHDIARSVTDLIGSVEGTELPGDAKKIILEKLNGVAKILKNLNHFSDNDIRLRVGSVIKDCCLQLNAANDDQKQIVEDMRQWAEPMLKGTSEALLLGPGAVAVSGFLKGPDEDREESA